MLKQFKVERTDHRKEARKKASKTPNSKLNKLVSKAS